MELNFTYGKKEWIDARRDYLFLSKAITKFQVIILPILAVIIGLSVALSGMTMINELFIVIFVVCSVILFYGCIIQPIWIFDKTSKYHSEYQLVFTEKGIEFRTDGIQSELSWNIYTDYLESDKGIYLIQTKGVYFWLPNRVFSSQEELERFRELAKKQLGMLCVEKQ